MCKWVVLGVLLASASVAVAEEPAESVAPPSETPSTATPRDPDASAPAPGASAPAPGAPATATAADASVAATGAPATPAAPAVAPPSTYTPLPYAEPIRPPPPPEPYRDRSAIPPLSGGRLVGELAIGSLFAVGGTIGGAYLGYGIETAGDGCHGEFCGFGGLILGGLVGLTFVTPLGVYLVGNSAGETGSLGATIGCSVLGILAGGGAVAMIEDEDVAPVLVLAGPVVGSMIGFNLTRRYVEKRPARAWAPVANVSHGTASFGVVGRF